MILGFQNEGFIDEEGDAVIVVASEIPGPGLFAGDPDPALKLVDRVFCLSPARIVEILEASPDVE